MLGNLAQLPAQALKGVTVLELGQLIAGPFCGMLLASYGATVIKIEPPTGGDPMRTWRKLHNGTSLWWHSISRNKLSITLDLKKPSAQEIVRRLVARPTDVIIENFRPGRMEEWGLGYEALSKLNQGLVMTRVSGWGQDGPYAHRPGFASVAEGIGGLRFVTGEPNRTPIRSSISLGDSLAGLHAAYGTLLALFHRQNNSGRGQVVDCAIYESVFNMMESLLPEYDVLGEVRQATGSKLPGIVPSSTYLCSDGKYVIIGGNSDSIFARLMNAINRSDLASDLRLKNNPGRVEHEEMIDQAIQSWISKHSLSEAMQILERAQVPVGPIYSIADIVGDAQYQSRKMFERINLNSGEAKNEQTVAIPRMTPLLSQTPAVTHTPAPALGEHNQLVYREWLGMSHSEYQELLEQGVV